MVSWCELLSDEKKQLKVWKSFLEMLGINRRKCPGFRTVLRVNICCINSFAFFLGTWILFYLAVVAIFCGAVTGSAALLGVK